MEIGHRCFILCNQEKLNDLNLFINAPGLSKICCGKEHTFLAFYMKMREYLFFGNDYIIF